MSDGAGAGSSNPNIAEGSVTHLPAGTIIEIRATVGGRTISWAVDLVDGTALSQEASPRLKLHGRIIAAGFADHVDRRIDNQIGSIKLLIDHVEYHHSQGGDHAGRSCTFLRQEKIAP